MYTLYIWHSLLLTKNCCWKVFLAFAIIEKFIRYNHHHFLTVVVVVEPCSTPVNKVQKEMQMYALYIWHSLSQTNNCCFKIFLPLSICTWFLQCSSLKYQFELSSLVNLIFSLFQAWILQATAGRKIQFKLGKKIQFIKLEI